MQGRGVSLFFIVAASALVLAAAGIGGLFVLNRAQESQRDEFIAQNRIKEESVRPELLQQVVLLDRRLKGVRTLIGEHMFTSNVFGVIEKNTHPQVRFLNFTFSADSLKLDMSGEAASYRALSRQIALFEQEPQIERTEFGGLSATSDGLVGFKLTLTFKPTLLHLRQ
ncbi:MAG: hypothetical protein A3J10_03625 [Candidatus Sungbacteria bacterium RIFCSPLOWO2_02_FULL_54_10]|uniref:PilN domain-containing protein n=1 Tax=Candidatus Sungbacteria bacterium RIFCSPHIGHO2_02_FULL_53_17 TaxID=1802275 RepID=A0A1G2KW41_9BACT|nr:MAG: hypothetical protein A3C92_02565 [Candidatus Sungbacteria bacterium RIFCSPHIGHO2_02_FULL_53_17]OHA11911.1 MAG: hypothetical protein A3J10_03625 [Candidatus Sungbacteria bacterium RIFCSPLOWO2_02_FULL_54_10]